MRWHPLPQSHQHYTQPSSIGFECHDVLAILIYSNNLAIYLALHHQKRSHFLLTFHLRPGKLFVALEAEDLYLLFTCHVLAADPGGASRQPPARAPELLGPPGSEPTCQWGLALLATSILICVKSRMALRQKNRFKFSCCLDAPKGYALGLISPASISTRWHLHHRNRLLFDTTPWLNKEISSPPVVHGSSGRSIRFPISCWTVFLGGDQPSCCFWAWRFCKTRVPSDGCGLPSRILCACFPFSFAGCLAG